MECKLETAKRFYLRSIKEDRFKCVMKRRSKAALSLKLSKAAQLTRAIDLSLKSA